jgi:predicted phage terminase large subunit-like protein
LYNALLMTPDGMFQVKEEMVELWFPQKLSFSHLMNTLKEKKERSFKNQQLNIATDESELDLFVELFKLDDLRAHSYARSATPSNRDMRVLQFWDIAYSDRKTSDFSVGATVGIYLTETKQEAVVVLDVVLGKWNQKELPFHVAAFYDKHKELSPKVFIEEALGVKWLRENLSNFCKVRGIDFVAHTIPVSTKPNAKRNRIKNLAFLLGQNRLHFVTGGWNDEVFKQFVEYKGGKSTTYRKDDAPDAISMVIEFLATSALLGNPDPKLIEVEHEKRVEKGKREGMYNRMFGGASPLRPKPVVPETEPPPVDPRKEAFKKMGRILPPGMRL